MTLVDLFGEDILICFGCGEPRASAYWAGQKQVSVCPDCAVEVLPKLLADALVPVNVSSRDLMNHLRYQLHRARANFWKAVAGAIHCSVRWTEQTKPPRD